MAWAASRAAHEGNGCGVCRCSGCPPRGTVPALGSPGDDGGTERCRQIRGTLCCCSPGDPGSAPVTRAAVVPQKQLSHPQPSPAPPCSTLSPWGEGALHPIAELTQQRIACVAAHRELLRGLCPPPPAPRGSCPAADTRGWMLGVRGTLCSGGALHVGGDTAGVTREGEQGCGESWGPGESCTGQGLYRAGQGEQAVL